MNYKFLASIAVFTILLSGVALAVPGIPHQIYGSVAVNGGSAPDGTTVVVKINGIEVASTTTSGGKYGYEPLFYVPDTDPPSRSGLTMKFYVNGVDTGKTSIFTNGYHERIDFSVTVEGGSTGGNSGGGGGGGSNGGSSGGSAATTTTLGQAGSDICREKWTCTAWNACTNGKQTRSCAEQNGCGTETYRPFEEQPCVSETTQAGQGIDFGATGSFLTSPIGIGAIVLVVAVIVGGLFFWKKKGAKPKKE